MLIRLRDLTSLSAIGDDGAHHNIADLLVRRDMPEITHVVTRLGGFLERRGCAVRIDGFGEPDLSQGLWPTHLDEDAARAAGEGGIVAILCDPDTLPDPADVAAAEGGAPLAALSSIDEKPVLAADGTQAGTVMDMVVDTETHRVAMLVLHTDGGHQRVVPAESFGKIDWEGGRVHLTCGAEPVSNAPDLHEVGAKIEGHWYNRVLAYYGIG